MSFGRSSNRSSSFGKQKKEKRKKQEFHKHKMKFSETQKIDFNALRDRTVVSLTHLGKQQFSQESGGYSFENWMKNFNLLLDNFEEEAGPHILSEDYFEKRKEFTATLLIPNDASELDFEISKLQDEENSLMEKLQKMGAKLTHEQESVSRNSKIDTLSMERGTIVDHLEEERKRLAQRKKEVEDSKKFFKRMFAGSKEKGPAISTIEARIDELENQAGVLERRIAQLRKLKDQSGYRVISEEELKHEFPKKFEELADVRERLEELRGKKLDETNNDDLREQITKSLSELISGITHPSESEAQFPAVQTVQADLGEQINQETNQNQTP